MLTSSWGEPCGSPYHRRDTGRSRTRENVAEAAGDWVSEISKATGWQLLATLHVALWLFLPFFKANPWNHQGANGWDTKIWEREKDRFGGSTYSIWGFSWKDKERINRVSSLQESLDWIVWANFDIFCQAECILKLTQQSTRVVLTEK